MTYQLDQWRGEFGDKWSVKDDYIQWEIESGIELKTDIIQEFLGDLPKTLSVLDIGCNVGFMIQLLHDVGFKKITGIDINMSAIAKAGFAFPHDTFIHGEIQDIDKKFDLVIHSAILVHIPPSKLDEAMKKIYDSCNRYIFGKEMSTPTPTDIGEISSAHWANMLWTRRFMRKWMTMFPDLKLVKSRLICPRIKNRLETEVFLLEKIK